MLDEISKAEGTRGYNDAFAHQHPGVDLSKMTINQVEALQRTQRGSPAIGRYQFMTATLESLKKDLNLSGNEMFTPDMQERLARSLLQRRGYDQWKAGKLSDKDFMHNLSKEWAGLTDPNTGRGYYPNQTTGHSLTQQFAALNAERDAKAATVAGASMPARPVTPTPSGYDRIRARLKALDAAGIKPGQEEWESSGRLNTGEPADKHDFNPWKAKPWGSIGKNNYGPEYDPMGNKKDGTGQQASLHRREPGALLRASNKMQADASATHKVIGEASLRIKLASGLVPDGGAKNKGSLFKEIRLDRAPQPLASTMG